MNKMILTLLLAITVYAQDSSVEIVDTLAEQFFDGDLTDFTDTISVEIDSIESDTVEQLDTGITDTIEQELSNDTEDSAETIDSFTIEPETLRTVDTTPVQETIDETPTLEEYFAEDDTTDVVSSATPKGTSPTGVIQLFKLFTLFFLFGIVAVIITVIKKWKLSRGNNFLTRTRISIMDREVQLICNYIEEHFADTTLTAETVCTALTTGLSFAESLFSKELDMTIDEFIVHVRIHQAVDMINRNFSGTATELMKQCGYQLEEQFRIDFKEVTAVDLDSLLQDSSEELQ